jgi:hypothetical protein
VANEVRITVTSRDKSAAGFQSARKHADEFGSSTKRVGEIAGGILASQVFERIASAAVQAFTSTINAASNLNESINATGVTFGAAGDQILTIGETADQAMGLSQRAFNEAAVRFSAFAKTIAGDGGNVANVVQDITQRASDFASVMNLDVEEALRLFQSGLAGESEPLRRYGIDVSAAAVNTFAYANGIAEAGRQLTETEKVQARYGLIMEQTSATSGDFANTSDDLANAQRILSAELENMQAQLGQNLLPVLASATGFVTDLVVGFSNLPKPVQTAAGVIAGLTVALGAAAGAARLLNVSLIAVAANPIVLAATATVGVAAATLAQFGHEARNAEISIAGLRATLDETTGAVTTSTREWVANRLVTEGLADDARKLGIDLNLLTDAYLGDAAASSEVRRRLEELRPEIGLAELATFGLTHALDDGEQARRRIVNDLDEQVPLLEEAQQGQLNYAAAAEESTGATEGASGAMRDFDSEIADTNTELDAQNQILSDLYNNLFAIENQILSTRDAERGLEAAIDAASEAVSANGETLDRNTEEGRANEAALDDIASSAHKLAEQQLEAGESGDTMRGSMRRAREQFIKTAESMGMAEEDAEALADKLGLIPSEVKTTAKFRDTTQAQIADLERRLNILTRSREINIRINQFTGTTQFGGQIATGGIIGAERGMQGGGISGASSRILVGEHRPEVVELPVGSRVIPSVDQAMDRGQAGGSGGPVAIELHSGGTRLDDLLLEVLRNSIRVRGGTVQTVLGS